MITVKQQGRSQMKSRNTIRVFKYILENGETSRSHLSEKLKISLPTISRITNNLIEQGLLNESGSEEIALGRKPTKLNINKEYGYIVGASLTRTKLHIVLCDMGLSIKEKHTTIIPDLDDSEQLVDFIGNSLESFMCINSQKKIIGIGIATRGDIDNENGVVLSCNMRKHYKNIELGNYLKNRFCCDVAIENNIKGLLLGNMMLDNSKIVGNQLCVYIHEGIGSSLIINDKIVRGFKDLAGQIGHMVVESNGRLCNCGLKGHLEPYSSNNAIEQSYMEESRCKTHIDIIEICNRANNGDKIAIKCLEQAIEKLAIALSNIQLTVSPHSIMIIGELFEYYQNSLKYLKESLCKYFHGEQYEEIEWIFKRKRDIMIEHKMSAVLLYSILNV